jgi:signal transduction histidine kinase
MEKLPNLLIVDDTEENLILLTAIIRDVPVNLIKASSGAEALEKTEGIELVLEILDVRMPVMDGYELAVKLNENRFDDKVPVIFLTANYSSDAELFRGYDSGAVDYIFKPLNRQVLVSKIKIFVELYSQKHGLKNSLLQLQQLSQHIEEVREDERTMISRELHDDLGQALTAVKIDLGIIKQKVSDEEVVSEIVKVINLVSNTIKAVQHLTSQLRPDIIDDLGLEAAIDWYTKEFEQRTGIRVSLDMDCELDISPKSSLSVFRIIQESLTNVARHSKATRVSVCINKDNGSINYMISDNGVGITEEQIKSKKSFGILSMKERVSSWGGSFDICNVKDGGTVIRVSFPSNNL